MIFVIEAIKRLYADDNFKTLLKAEGLISFPKVIEELLEQGGSMSDLDGTKLSKSPIKIGFETEVVTLALNQIIPLKIIPPVFAIV